MAIATAFHNWSDHPHAQAQKTRRGSPALMRIRDHHLARWGGRSLSSSSLFDFRLLDNGKPSPHAGCAVDLRWEDPGPGRAVVLNEMLPFYIGNSRELHIQAIHDYVGCRVWRANRSHDANGGWKTQRQGSHSGNMGNPRSQWLHLEVSPDGWGDDRPVEEMLGVAGQVVPDIVPRGGRTTVLRRTEAAPIVTDLRAGMFGLFPLDPAKPRRVLGDRGDHVLYAQSVIFFKGGGAIRLDADFNEQTRTRVMDLQRVFGLEDDGRIGRDTWGAIDFLAVR